MTDTDGAAVTGRVRLGGPLHAVRREAVTAAEALGWFCAVGGEHPGGQAGAVIGYLLAPDRAEWFRCARQVPRGPDGAVDLAGAFEVHATTGACQLRWMHEAGGTGWAVVLGEDASALPAGDRLAEAGRRRVVGLSERLLAGRVASAGDGWALLVTARYKPVMVPVDAAADQDVWARFAEYAVSDEHGNLSVIDTLLVSLAARDHRDVTEGRS